MTRVCIVEPVTVLALGRETMTVAPNLGRKTARLVRKLLAIGGLVKQREQVPYIEHRVFDTQDVVAQLLKNREVLHKLNCLHGDAVVLIGAAQFRELVDIAVSKPMSFTTHIHRGGIPSVMGMRVVIVPWMDGLVILPTELLE